MNREWESVKEFHRRFGVPHEEAPRRMPEERRRFRANLLMEEIREFLEAETLEDQADAMIDTIYLALGTLVEMGVRPAKLFDIVHEANMGKLWEDGKPRYREDGKVIKPPAWQSPEPLIRAEIRRQSGAKPPQD